MRIFRESQVMYQAAVIFIEFCFLTVLCNREKAFLYLGQPIIMVTAFISAVCGNTLKQAAFAWLIIVAVVHISIYFYTVQEYIECIQSC